MSRTQLAHPRRLRPFHRPEVTALVGLLAVLAGPFALARLDLPRPPTARPAGAAAERGPGRVPAWFEPNVGQLGDPSFDFVSRGGPDFGLAADRATFLAPPSAGPVLRMRLVGADEHAV